MQILQNDDNIFCHYDARMLNIRKVKKKDH